MIKRTSDRCNQKKNIRATEDQLSAHSKNSKMGGILSTTNSLKFGDAVGTEGSDKVEQIQENHGHIGGSQLTNNSVEFGRAKGNQVNQHQTNRGNIGDDMNFNIDKSGNRSDSQSGDYAKAKPGLPADEGDSFSTYAGPAGHVKGKITIKLDSAEGH